MHHQKYLEINKSAPEQLWVKWNAWVEQPPIRTRPCLVLYVPVDLSFHSENSKLPYIQIFAYTKTRENFQKRNHSKMTFDSFSKLSSWDLPLNYEYGIDFIVKSFSLHLKKIPILFFNPRTKIKLQIILQSQFQNELWFEW